MSSSSSTSVVQPRSDAELGIKCGMNTTLPAERTFEIKQPVLDAVLPLVASFECLFEYGRLVLTTADSDHKAAITRLAIEHYLKGLPIFPVSSSEIPSVPTRPTRPFVNNTIAREQMPTKIHNDAEANRIRLVHSLAHIESYAIDLAWDILMRFASSNNRGVSLPREYYEEWLRVAGEESLHYTIWSRRLIELGSEYGALPVHDGLWQSAGDTSVDILARLAIVHMVHEARGLDTAPRQMSQFASMGDKVSRDLLGRIENDEITHVGAGVTWFNYVCSRISQNPPTTFHEIVPQFFKGRVFGPFNDECRKKAGMTEDYYLPLVAITEERLKKQKEEKERIERERLEQEEKKRAEESKIDDAALPSSSTAQTVTVPA